jgi:hypothetical protein
MDVTRMSVLLEFLPLRQRSRRSAVPTQIQPSVHCLVGRSGTVSGAQEKIEGMNMNEAAQRLADDLLHRYEGVWAAGSSGPRSHLLSCASEHPRKLACQNKFVSGESKTEKRECEIL